MGREQSEPAREGKCPYQAVHVPGHPELRMDGLGIPSQAIAYAPDVTKLMSGSGS